MEEAYTELYREFIRLRSLCIKQTALLQKLMDTLQSQQGVSVPIQSLSDMASVPIQFKQEFAGLLINVGTEPQRSTAQNPVSHYVVAPPSSVATISDVLTEDMGRLTLEMIHSREEKKEIFKAPPYLTLEPHGFSGAMAISNVSINQMKVDPLAGDNEMPGLCDSFLNNEFLSQCGGILMSELALQSEVCEFCQAVFPGQTTTRGEFLRHLHSHIT